MPIKPTKILFIDNDEMSFEVRRCVVRVIKALPPVEIYHASDATEALEALERFNPDVVVADEDCEAELSLFLDALTAVNTPVLLQTNRRPQDVSLSLRNKTTLIDKEDSIEGLRKTLLAATSAVGCPTTLEKTQMH